MKDGWGRRRWWEFRQGHSIYLVFALTFINFILISYRLLIEKITFLQEIIPDLWMFAILFLIVYVPAAILIGYWHRKTQLRVETTMIQQQNPVLATMIRTLLDVQTGKATKDEIGEVRKMLTEIETDKTKID